MITQAKLFQDRVLSYWSFQWKVFRTAVDWIVAIYFVVPALIAVGYVYSSWWLNPPEWFAMIPFSLVLTGLYILCNLGTTLSAVPEAGAPV